MAYTNIDDPSAYFQVTLYTGTGASQSITNDGNSDMQPDLWWQINRDLARGTYVADSSRGVTKYLTTFTTNADSTVTNYVTSFDSDGFTLGNGDTAVNNNAQRFVTWNWKANGGTTSSNTDGSITSTVQANTTAGFSIVTYTGTGSAGTVGHGLGATPAMIIQKNRDSSANWSVRHHKTTNNYDFLNLNLNSAATANDSIWTQTNPTTSVFSIGTASAINQSGQDQVCYCFAEKKGYSKFGKYMGNGNTNGTFVYTGFKPAFVMQKRIDSTGSWHILDGTRNSFNETDNYAYADLSYAEYNGSNDGMDFLSNGFKLSNTYTGLNASGYSSKYIYAAFAENPFVTSTGIPTTAR